MRAKLLYFLVFFGVWSVAGSALEAHRVLSLAPSITEMIFELNGQAALVGNTTACDYPHAAKQMPKVGDFLSPNLEKMKMLQPDYILGMGYPKGPVRNAIQRLGIPVRWIDTPQTVSQIQDVMREVGHYIGKTKEAEKWVQRQKDVLRHWPKPPLNPKKVVVVVWASPLIVAGSSTFIEDMVRLAGGKMAIQTQIEYPKISAEKMIRANPDVVIVVEESQKALLQKIPGVSRLKAVQEATVVSANLVCRPGPRWRDAVAQLSSVLKAGPKI
jgi:iron complex transport system substrate-binding protein